MRRRNQVSTSASPATTIGVQQGFPRPRRLGALVLLMAIGWTAASAVRSSAAIMPLRQDGSRHGTHRLKPVRRHSLAPLVFGIYPGGAAGAVGLSGRVIPDDPGKQLSALEQLRPAGRPFLVRLYMSFTGPQGPSAAQQVDGQVSEYTAAGFGVELVLAYRPAPGAAGANVASFVAFVRDAVLAFGPDRGVMRLQVTNEANVLGAPNASDGYYAGAKDALIQGVIAAKAETLAMGYRQVKVGFNWAYSTGRGEGVFWRYLDQHGGRAFARDVDWVGLDIYPGTWGPPLGRLSLSRGAEVSLNAAFAALRGRYMPLAGLAGRIPLQVSENGYPTGPGRTDAMQVVEMKAAVAAVEAAQATYNITDYIWFDLRDAASTSGSFQSRYGLLNDDYSPKPAFGVYRELVAQAGSPAVRSGRTSAAAYRGG